MRLNTLEITSPDFEPDGPLPIEFTAVGANKAPRLMVDGIPAATTELAIICHDPDAPFPHGFTHWLLFGIPTEGRQRVAVNPASARQGSNETGRLGYYGPEPPTGHGTHRYYFWVYALDCVVAGEPDRRDFLDEYGSHILEQNRVVGTFAR